MSESAKIKLKVGSIELEYEGDPSFLKEGLESLLVTMTDLAKVAPPEDVPDEVGLPPASSPPNSNGGGNGLNLSTNTIAARTNSKSGPEILLCALAQLELVQGKEESSRSEILDEMKRAKSYFNENMRKNMSNHLESVIKSRKVNQHGTDKYSLSAAERKSFEDKLAQH